MKKYTSMHIFAGFILFAICAYIVFIHTHSYNHVEFSDLTWKKPPSLIAIQNVAQGEQEGLLFIRPSDGEEQFMPGSWNVTYSERGVYAYQTEHDEEEKHVYFFSNDEKIYPLTLQTPGRIVHVEEHPSNGFVFVQTQHEGVSSFCIIEGLQEETTPCQKLGVNRPVNATWIPDKDFDIALKTEAYEMLTFTITEARTRTIETSDPQHAKIAALFEDQHDPRTTRTMHDTSKRYWRLGNILVIRNNSSWELHRLPWGTRKLSWYSDDDHILLVRRHTLEALELSTRSVAPITTKEYIEQAPLSVKTLDTHHTF